MATVEDIIDEIYEEATLSQEFPLSSPEYFKNLDELITILTKLVEINKISCSESIVKIFKIICFVDKFTIHTKRYFLNNILLPRTTTTLQRCIVEIFECFLKVSFFNTNESILEKELAGNGMDSDGEGEDDGFEDERYAVKDKDRDPTLNSKSLQNDILKWFIQTFPLWKDVLLERDTLPFFNDLYSKFFYLMNYEHLRQNIVTLLALLTTRSNCRPFRSKIMLHYYKQSKDYKFLVLYKLYTRLLPALLKEHTFVITCNRRIETFIKKRISEIVTFACVNYTDQPIDGSILKIYQHFTNESNLKRLVDDKLFSMDSTDLQKIPASKIQSVNDFITYYPNLVLPPSELLNSSHINRFSLLYLALQPKQEVGEYLEETVDILIREKQFGTKRLHLAIHLLSRFFPTKDYNVFNNMSFTSDMEKNLIVPCQKPVRDLSHLLDIKSMDIESIYLCLNTITKTLLQNKDQHDEYLHYISFFKNILFKILAKSQNLQYNRHLSLSFIHLLQLSLEFPEDVITSENVSVLLGKPSEYYTLIVKLNDPLLINYLCKVIVKYRPFVEENCMDGDNDEIVDALNELTVHMTNYLWRNTKNMYTKGVFAIKGPFISKVIQDTYNFNTYLIKSKDFLSVSGISTFQYCFKKIFMDILQKYAITHFPYPTTESSYLKFIMLLQQENPGSMLPKDFPDFVSIKISILQQYPYEGVKKFLFTSLKSLEKVSKPDDI